MQGENFALEVAFDVGFKLFAILNIGGREGVKREFLSDALENPNIIKIF